MESSSSNFSNNADVGTMATIPTDATVEQLRAIAMEAIAAAAQERERANAAQAAANATWRRKKPELPAFDKQHVDLWIKRVESAYHREGITLPKDKFAFLEASSALTLVRQSTSISSATRPKRTGRVS